MEVTSGRRLGYQPCGRASHGCCPFPAVLERLLPVQPLHLLTFRNRPALFRHLSSRPPVLRQALGPMPAGTRGTHSFNDGGVCWATSGANSARGAGWGLRSAVPSGVRSRARGQQGRQSRPDRSRKGRRPHVATGSRTDPRALPADAWLWPAPPRESEIPREQSSRPGHPRASGFGAGARARVVTAAVSGLTLRPGTAPQGDPTRGAESPAGAGPRQKPGL